MSERPYDVITFDCYGTLIDWRGGIGAAFREAAARDGVPLDTEDVLRVYNEVEPVVEEEMYRSYRAVLTETARRVGPRLSWPVPAERASFLPESLPSWKPFADTNAALERLVRAGYTLGILSNVDDDLLTGTRRHFTVEFEIVVTAQQVRSYKPAPGHFTVARQRIGPRRWLHAAQSYFHDIVPAVSLGVPVAWINRHRQPTPVGGARPTRELEKLSELADWLA